MVILDIAKRDLLRIAIMVFSSYPPYSQHEIDTFRENFIHAFLDDNIHNLKLLDIFSKCVISRQ